MCDGGDGEMRLGSHAPHPDGWSLASPLRGLHPSCPLKGTALGEAGWTVSAPGGLESFQESAAVTWLEAAASGLEPDSTLAQLPLLFCFLGHLGPGRLAPETLRIAAARSPGSRVGRDARVPPTGGGPGKRVLPEDLLARR